MRKLAETCFSTRSSLYIFFLLKSFYFNFIFYFNQFFFVLIINFILMIKRAQIIRLKILLHLGQAKDQL